MSATTEVAKVAAGGIVMPANDVFDYTTIAATTADDLRAGAVTISVPGDIVPWARAGGRGHMRFTPKPQHDYMATLRQFAADAMAGQPLFDGAVEMIVTATWLWPKGLSAKKRALPGADRKATKSDADNISKIIKDALNLVVFTDDARVSDLHVVKRWGDQPGLTITVAPVAAGGA